MPVAITRNSYRFPRGYAKSRFPTTYIPWNGAVNSPSPGRSRLGATQVFNIASVPADLSTFILNTPDGRSFTFQFVYNASVQTLGIKIPLPLSGASTAAQVQTAMAAVLGAGSGTPIGGSPVVFPWVYNITGAAQFRIDWSVGGTAVASSGTQATITAGAVVASVFSVQAPAPGRFGHNNAWLHGT
jgi:hypothetical protein